MYNSILSSFSDVQLAKLNKAAEDSTFDINEVSNHIMAVLGVDLPTVTVQELVDSAAVEELNQFDIVTNKVFNVCLSLLQDAVLYEHIKIGFKDVSVVDGVTSVGDGSFIITSGRHRLTALLTLAELFQAGEDFYSQAIPVIATSYNPGAIVHANGSRSMSPAEKAAVSISSLGIDPSDNEALLCGFLDGVLKVAAVGALYQNIAQTIISHDLQPTTLSTIGKSFYTNAKRSKTSMARALTQPDFLNRIMELAAANTDKAIELVGENNIARNATAIGMRLVTLVKDNPEIVQYLAAMEPVKAAKKEAKPKSVSSSRKPKAVAPVEEVAPITEEIPVTLVDAPHPAEVSIASEVATPKAVAPKPAAKGTKKTAAKVS